MERERHSSIDAPDRRGAVIPEFPAAYGDNPFDQATRPEADALIEKVGLTHEYSTYTVLVVVAARIGPHQCRALASDQERHRRHDPKSRPHSSRLLLFGT